MVFEEVLVVELPVLVVVADTAEDEVGEGEAVAPTSLEDRKVSKFLNQVCLSSKRSDLSCVR